MATAPGQDPRKAAVAAASKRAKEKAVVHLSGCTGCEVCIAVCPVDQCIQRFGASPETNGVFVNYDKCIGCELCVKYCPWETIDMVPTAEVGGYGANLTSLSHQKNHEHPVFKNLNILPSEIQSTVNKTVTSPTPA